MASYVDRITKIKEELQATVDRINDKEEPTETEEEKLETYEAAVELLDQAVDELETLI